MQYTRNPTMTKTDRDTLRSLHGRKKWADAAVDCLLAVAYSDGCILCDLAGQLQHVLHQFSLRIHSVHQTNAQSLVRLDVQCRVDQLLCHTHADQTCQTLGAAEARGDAQTHFRLAEHSVVRADADLSLIHISEPTRH